MQQIDSSFLAWFQQLAQMQLQMSDQNIAQLETFNFEGINPADLQALQGTQFYQGSEQQKAQKIELIKMYVSAALRDAKMKNKDVADYSTFMDPSIVSWGPTIWQQNPSLGQKTTYTVDGVETSRPIEKVLNMDASQLLFSGDDPSTTDVIESRVIQLLNRVTGNGFVIDGNNVHTVVEGKVTATTTLDELFKLNGQEGTGTINLENGTKITFFLKPDDLGKARVDRIAMTHPDSFAEIANIQDPTQALQVFGGEGEQMVTDFLDSSIMDGQTYFMGPEGASLHTMDPTLGQFVAAFGDPRALSIPLLASSFGGNLYNFFWSAMDQGWHAVPLLPKNLIIPPDAPGFPPGFPGIFPEPPGFNGPPVFEGLPDDWGLPGLYPPPGNWAPPPALSGGSIEDLIFEDLTGFDPTGHLTKAKNKYLKQLLRNGRMGLETKLFIILHLFLQENDTKIEDILKDLAGVDYDGNEVVSHGKWNEDNIHLAPIKYQMEFWSQHKANNLSSNQSKRNEQLQEHSTMVNGKMQGAQIDQALLMARLTNMIRDRQRFVDTITNALKSLDDALANAVRRIV